MAQIEHSHTPINNGNWLVVINIEIHLYIRSAYEKQTPEMHNAWWDDEE